jgi:hypothetical protein
MSAASEDRLQAVPRAAPLFVMAVLVTAIHVLVKR